MIGHKSDALAVGTPSWKLHEARTKGKAHNGVVSQLADPNVIVASVWFHLVKSHTAAVRRDGGIGKDALGSHHAYLLAAAVEPGQLRLGSALSGLHDQRSVPGDAEEREVDLREVLHVAREGARLAAEAEGAQVELLRHQSGIAQVQKVPGLGIGGVRSGRGEQALLA